MRVLIIGYGSIGKRHGSNLKKIDPKGVIDVLHTSNTENKRLNNINEVYTDFDLAVENNPDLTIISTPAFLHMKYALKLAELGGNMFIEKPLSLSLKCVDKLIDTVNKNKSIVMVGYNFRFNPCIIAMKNELNKRTIGDVYYISSDVGQYLPDWRPNHNYIDSSTARLEESGGILFELSHEFDYIRWLFGDINKVQTRLGKISKLSIKEDYADINLEFKNKSIGHIHMDLLNRSYKRGCYIIGEKGTMIWRDEENSLKLYLSEEKIWKNIIESTITYDRNDMYVSEMKHYLKCVRERNVPLISLLDGKKILKIIIASKKSSDSKEVETV